MRKSLYYLKRLDRVCFSDVSVVIMQKLLKQFAMSLRENVAQIGGFKVIIDKDKIVEAIKIPQTREHWFKGGKVDKKRCRPLLLPLPTNAKLKIGVLVRFLKPEW